VLPSLADFSPAPAAVTPVAVTAHQLRQMQVSEFAEWLRTQTNKHKRPFQEQTIHGCSGAAHVLDRWMESRGSTGTSPRATWPCSRTDMVIPELSPLDRSSLTAWRMPPVDPEGRRLAGNP
jgi:hypothetical protein